MNKKKVLLTLIVIFTTSLLNGFWSDDSRETKIKERLEENKKTLQLLYKSVPSSRSEIKNAYGYATFSNVGVNLIILSAEGGTGLAHSNKTGKNIYMNMGSGGVGFGLGVKDFRAVFLFETKKAFDTFVEHGWEANAQADLAAKSDNKGIAESLAITVAPGVKLYKLTKNGLAVQATIQGTRYWKDSELN